MSHLDDAPTASDLTSTLTGWSTAASEVKYENPWLLVREDTAIRPDGSECIYGVMSTKAPGVLIIAFDEQGRVPLVTADRYPLGDRQLEVPGGGCDDGETAAQAGARELLEECGLRADRVEEIGAMTVLGGLVEHRNRVVVAYGCREVPAAERPEQEDDVAGYEMYTPGQVLRLITDGQIVDAETVCALTQAFLAAGHLGQTLPAVTR